AQYGRAGVGEMPRPPLGPTGRLARRSGKRGNDRAGGVRRRARPPVEPAEDRLPQRQQGWPAGGRRGVKEQRASPVAVTLPGWLRPLVEERGAAVDHRAQPLPGRFPQRVASGPGLARGQQRELGDEALVVRCELTAEARREGVADELAFEETGRLPLLAIDLREPAEGAACHELPGRLRDDVVVGRRAPAPERGQVFVSWYRNEELRGRASPGRAARTSSKNAPGWP